MTDLGSVTQDSTTKTSNTIQALGSQKANYIRNSVKATVDAYDGSVELYAWDANDPVLKAWEKIFPGQYHPISEISGDLMSHLRYPENLFKVQRELLAKYHVSSAGQFFSGEDFWQTPVDPTESATAQQQGVPQPPYYLSLQTGGSKKPVFSLTSSYIPAGTSTREILTGFLSVDSDAGNEKGRNRAELRHNTIAGAAQGLQRSRTGQAQNNFNANADVSKELNLLESGSTKGQPRQPADTAAGWRSGVYVQPVYVQSSGSTSFPLLKKKVLVAFGDQVGFANTLDEALDQVFGGNSGASAGDAENSGNTSQSGDEQNSGGQNGTESGDGSESNGNANGSGTNEGKDQNGSSAGRQPKPRASASAEGCGPSDEGLPVRHEERRLDRLR